MIEGMVIRDETPADVEAIAELTEAAFRDLAVSNHTEQFIVAALRKSGALAVSLVAEMGGEVAGHIAFSPVKIGGEDVGWYGLGPVSVRPALQRRGIGSALIREGLARLKAMGARGCCLVGHKEYYPRFGFRNTPGLTLEGVPAEVFFALPFGDETPRGAVQFDSAFMADGR